MKNITTKFTQAWLAALLLWASLLVSAPCRAEEAPGAEQAAPQVQATDGEIRVAWDRVGSPERSFG